MLHRFSALTLSLLVAQDFNSLIYYIVLAIFEEVVRCQYSGWLVQIRSLLHSSGTPNSFSIVLHKHYVLENSIYLHMASKPSRKIYLRGINLLGELLLNVVLEVLGIYWRSRTSIGIYVAVFNTAGCADDEIRNAPIKLETTEKLCLRNAISTSMYNGTVWLGFPMEPFLPFTKYRFLIDLALSLPCVHINNLLHKLAQNNKEIVHACYSHTQLQLRIQNKTRWTNW